jgi:ATP-dependent RNA helicase RhlE
MPREIGHLADELLRDPVKVAVTPAATTVEKVAQRVIHIETHKKRALLAELFADAQITRALVFTRTKRGADRVAKHLEAAGVSVAAIHGNKSQKQRELALDAFRQARIRALVATDIAARGIDIDRVSHVVNYELPDVPESYVHRIGRTARAGAAGIAISLCDAEERAQLRDIERLTRQTIAAEDRRNDASLVAEGRVSGRPRRHASGHSDGGQRHGARDRHRAGGERRHAEHRDSHRGGHDHAEAASSRGHDGRNQHRGQRNGKANGHQHSARTPASASTGPSGMERVAFMARPSQARPIGRSPDRDKGHRPASRPVRY